ncbi:MAG: hypothetical protein ACE14M_00580 [Terriglobales bacterium]
MVTHRNVFIVFFTVQVLGILLLTNLGVLNLRGNSLVLETGDSLLIVNPANCLLAAAALLGWDLLNAVVIVKLFRRTGLG